MKKAKIYLSDEGYGHIVRQQAIIEQINSLSNNSISFSLQTHKFINVSKEINTVDEFIDKYNNISWHKKKNGSPDLIKIKKHFKDYEIKSKSFIKSEEDFSRYNFIISDFVYEAFELASLNNIPSFGVAHFTWDWFFSKLYPPPLSSKTLDLFFKYANKATKIYFPPFTPKEIINHYENAKEMPLIIRNNHSFKTIKENTLFKVLIIDSGSGLLKNSIDFAMKNVKELDDFQFYVADGYFSDSSNVSTLKKGELMIDYIHEMDLIISRAGFNTISECIAYRKPMLLIGEAMNPEINENIINLKIAGLASFISLEEFENGLKTFLPSFVKNEYKSLRSNMENHQINLNGAELIAEDILKNIN